MAFEKVGSEVVYEGRIGTVRVEKFRHDDGEVVEREVVEHPGASVMLPLDGDRIWLVRQPREVVGEELARAAGREAERRRAARHREARAARGDRQVRGRAGST